MNVELLSPAWRRLLLAAKQLANLNDALGEISSEADAAALIETYDILELIDALEEVEMDLADQGFDIEELYEVTLKKIGKVVDIDPPNYAIIEEEPPENEQN